MLRTSSLYPLSREFKRRLPSVRGCLRRGLALWVKGTILAHNGCQDSAAAVLEAHGCFETVRRELREWTCDDADRIVSWGPEAEVDAGACFPELPGWVLDLWTSGREPLVLVLDPTHQRDEWVALVVGVAYREHALPVAWHVVRADASESWIGHFRRLLGQLAPAVPTGMPVHVLCDRGLDSRDLWVRIRELGWHPVLRYAPTSPSAPPAATGFWSGPWVVVRARSGWGRGKPSVAIPCPAHRCGPVCLPPLDRAGLSGPEAGWLAVGTHAPHGACARGPAPAGPGRGHAAGGRLRHPPRGGPRPRSAARPAAPSPHRCPTQIPPAAPFPCAAAGRSLPPPPAGPQPPVDPRLAHPHAGARPCRRPTLPVASHRLTFVPPVPHPPVLRGRSTRGPTAPVRISCRIQDPNPELRTGSRCPPGPAPNTGPPTTRNCTTKPEHPSNSSRKYPCQPSVGEPPLQSPSRKRPFVGRPRHGATPLTAHDRADSGRSPRIRPNQRHCGSLPGWIPVSCDLRYPQGDCI